MRWSRANTEDTVHGKTPMCVFWALDFGIKLMFKKFVERKEGRKDGRSKMVDT